MNPQNTKKILVVVGPTASGKSDLAVYLAKKFGGEVISADSRQVYKGLDVGTGKVPRDPNSYKLKAKSYFYKGIPHHLLDVASPKRVFTVTEYKSLAEKALGGIWRRGKLPIVCGGTGFYIRAVIDNLVIPEVPPDKKLRRRLDKKTVDELFAILKSLDPRRAKEIDAKNPRRLIRAIEIATALGHVPRLEASLPSYDVLKVGLTLPDKILKQRIHIRLFARISRGMVAETKRLHKQGLSWKRMDELGLEYRYLARYLKKQLTKEQLTNQLEIAIWQYAKRQRTWFKKDGRIKWFSVKDLGKVEKLVRRFLK